MSKDKSIQKLLATVIDGNDLTKEQMYAAMEQIMTGRVSDILISAFLVSLRTKGESISEIQGAAQVMRDLVTGVDLGVHYDQAIDIVGTGGDGANIFNVSTASALVVAAAGGYVAKHGNRALSSKSGSADLLEQAGAQLDISPDHIPSIMAKTHFCFMFAPRHHSAMKYAAGVRTALAQRTIFNLLGPITNPAKIKHQLMGCYSHEWLEPLSKVLANLGCERTMLVHSYDGLDEVSLAGATRVVSMLYGELQSYDISPEHAGIKSRSLDSCIVSSPAHSYSITCQGLSGEHKDAADLIALNAGLAIQLAGISDDFASGVELAKQQIACGAPMEILDKYVDATKSYAEQ